MRVLPPTRAAARIEQVYTEADVHVCRRLGEEVCLPSMLNSLFGCGTDIYGFHVMPCSRRLFVCLFIVQIPHSRDRMMLFLGGGVNELRLCIKLFERGCES